MPTNRSRARAAAVEQFYRDYDPRKPCEPVLCGKCFMRHDRCFDKKILYRMDKAAMMHEMGDEGVIRFNDDNECLSILREQLIDETWGAVVCWKWRQIYLKRYVPKTFVDAKVHVVDDCSCFWVMTKQYSFEIGPLRDLSAYVSSFESDIPCPPGSKEPNQMSCSVIQKKC